MKANRISLLAVVAISSLAAAACGKKDEEQTETTEQPAAPEETAQGEGEADSPDENEPEETAERADFIELHVSHKEPKPDDPVVVRFEGIEVVSAEFDPDDLEGGKATIEVDMASLASGVPKRDRHLKSEDYFSIGEFAKATIEVSDVVEKDGAYQAKATVNVHGVEKEWPVSFEVVEKTDSGIVIRGEHELSRLDFDVGKPTSDEDEGAGEEVQVVLQLTLEPTAS